MVGGSTAECVVELISRPMRWVKVRRKRFVLRNASRRKGIAFLWKENFMRTIKRAFSLLELLAVVTILGIMAVVIIPRIGGSTTMAKHKMCDQYKSDLNSAIEHYFIENGVLPTSLEDIHTDDYYPGDLPVCPVDGSSYTIDSVSGRISGHAH